MQLEPVLEHVPFIALGMITLAGAAVAVALRDALQSALFLALSCTGVAGLLWLLGAWPIALLQLAVFVASIAVLIRTAPPFIREMTRSSSLGHNRRWWAAALVAVALCGTLGYVVRSQDWMAFGGSASMLGTAPVDPLRFALPGALALLLLAVAFVGAVTIVRER